MDLGEVTKTPCYKTGSPHSTNASHLAADNKILSAVKAEGTPNFFVAGDLVEGHWGLDTAKPAPLAPSVPTRKGLLPLKWRQRCITKKT